MRVMIVSSSFLPKVDGSTRCVYDHSRKLAEREESVYLVTRGVTSKDGSNSVHAKRFEEFEGIKIVRTKASPSSSTNLNLDKGRLLVEQILLILGLQRKLKFDLIHVHGFSALYAAIPCKLVYRVPILITTHGSELLWPSWVRWKNPAEVRLGLLFEKIALNFCDIIIAQSQGVRDYMVKFYGRRIESKIMLVHTGVDHQKFSPQKKFMSNPCVLFVGALSEVKGVSCLINAFARVHEKISDSILVLAGSGPAMQTYKDKVMRLGLGGSVRFTGAIRDDRIMMELYRDADVVVLPSNVGGPISCTILEGLSSGRPVISTNVPGGIPDVIDQNVGALIEAQDTDQLTVELLKLLTDRTYLEKIGSNARKKVEENYTLDSMIDRLYVIYRGIEK